MTNPTLAPPWEEATNPPTADAALWRAIETLQDASAWLVAGNREQVLAAIEEARDHLYDAEQSVEDPDE